MQYTNSAVSALQGLLESGRLASQYERYVQELRHSDNGWFKKVLATEGIDAAEKALSDVVRRNRMHDFAGSIEPLAQGMLALAKTDVDCEHSGLGTVTEGLFPRIYQIVAEQRIVVLNREPVGCGCACHTVRGSCDWRMLGRLGLRAITLEAGRGSKAYHAKVGLVLKFRSSEETNKSGFTVLTFGLNGFPHAEAHTPSVSADGYLRYVVGMQDAQQAIWHGRSSGGDIDDQIGFPGATAYIASALPSLVQYLNDLAIQVAAHQK